MSVMLFLFLFLFVDRWQACAQSFANLTSVTCNACYGYGTISLGLGTLTTNIASFTHVSILEIATSVATFTFDKAHLDPGQVTTSLPFGTPIAYDGTISEVPTPFLIVHALTWVTMLSMNNKCVASYSSAVALDPISRYMIAAGQPIADALQVAEIGIVKSVLAQDLFCSPVLAAIPTTDSTLAPTLISTSTADTSMATTASHHDTDMGVPVSTKVAIGVATMAGGLLLLAFPMFLIWKRRHLRNDDCNSKVAHEIDAEKVAAEKDSQIKYELPDGTWIFEMTADNETHPSPEPTDI